MLQSQTIETPPTTIHDLFYRENCIWKCRICGSEVEIKWTYRLKKCGIDAVYRCPKHRDLSSVVFISGELWQFKGNILVTD